MKIFNLNLNVVKNKKAAMFGLDARIALAIFGALSVISGAALYSAIEQAKVVQWQTYFNELTKASEAYYMDTRRPIPLTSHTSYDTERLWLSLNDLAINEDNVSGWQGPYWQTIYHRTGNYDYYIRDNMTGTIYGYSQLQLWLRQTSNWTASTWDSAPYTNELCAANSTDCAEWWVIDGSNSAATAGLLKLFNLLDEKIDNGDGEYAGNIRYSTSGNDFLFVKGRPRVYR